MAVNVTNGLAGQTLTELKKVLEYNNDAESKVLLAHLNVNPDMGNDIIAQIVASQKK